MAIHGFTAGTLVICTYRTPSALQPWMHEFYVGEVQEPGDHSRRGHHVAP